MVSIHFVTHAIPWSTSNLREYCNITRVFTRCIRMLVQLYIRGSDEIKFAFNWLHEQLELLGFVIFTSRGDELPVRTTIRSCRIDSTIHFPWIVMGGGFRSTHCLFFVYFLYPPTWVSVFRFSPWTMWEDPPHCCTRGASYSVSV